MLCDVCGRDNPDRLLYCQDCGKRLKAPAPSKSQGGEPPSAAPPSMPKPGTVTGSESRRSRPEAPSFSFAPPAPPSLPEPPPSGEITATSVAPTCDVCGAANPPNYRYCAVCGGTISRGGGSAGPGPAEASAAPAPSVPAPNIAAPSHPAAAVAASSSAPAAGVPAASPAVPMAAPSPRLVAPPPTQGVAQPLPPPSPSQSGALVGAPVVAIAEPARPRPTMLSCPRCQGQSDSLARFCKYCGASLPGSVHAGAPAPSRPHNGDGGPAPAPPQPTPIMQPSSAAPALVAAAPAPAPAPVPAAQAPLPVPAPVAAPPDRPAPQAIARIAPVQQAVPAGVSSPLIGSGIAPTSDTVQTRAPSAAPGPQVPPPSPSRPAGAPHPARLQAPKQKPARLVVVVEDGSDGKAFDLASPEVIVGRTEGDVLLFDDPYVAPRHALLVERAGVWHVEDLKTLNGVYKRSKGRTPLENGDLILLGSQVLQFQLVSEEERNLGPVAQHGTRVFGSKPVNRLARLDQRSTTGLQGDVYYVHRDETVLGREVGDIVFTADAFLSRKHAVLRRDPAKDSFTIEDLESSNGTYVAIRQATPVKDGDRIRIGQHLFRFEAGGAQPGGGGARGAPS